VNAHEQLLKSIFNLNIVNCTDYYDRMLSKSIFFEVNSPEQLEEMYLDHLEETINNFVNDLLMVVEENPEPDELAVFKNDDDGLEETQLLEMIGSLLGKMSEMQQEILGLKSDITVLRSTVNVENDESL